MGKAADDQYMGGGSGNWSRAPKKKTVAKTTRSTPPKPKAKPAKKNPIGTGAKPKTAPLKQRVNRGRKANQMLGGVREEAGRRQERQVNRMSKSSRLRKVK